MHAELRYNDEGAWILECMRDLSAGCAHAPSGWRTGFPLEELILVHALGGNVWMAEVDGPASA